MVSDPIELFNTNVQLEEMQFPVHYLDFYTLKMCTCHAERWLILGFGHLALRNLLSARTAFSQSLLNVQSLFKRGMCFQVSAWPPTVMFPFLSHGKLVKLSPPLLSLSYIVNYLVSMYVALRVNLFHIIRDCLYVKMITSHLKWSRQLNSWHLTCIIHFLTWSNSLLLSFVVC